MTPVWFDSHCHLDHGGVEEAAHALTRARAAGVVGVITVGCGAASSRAAIDIAAMHDGVWATVGLHPTKRSTASTPSSAWSASRESSRSASVGSTSTTTTRRPAQRGTFAAQIRLAHEHELPLVVHREAWEFAILDAEGVPASTVFHCFTGGPAEASLPRPRCTAVVLRHRHVPQRLRGAGRGANLPGGPAAHRDGLALPTPVPHRGRRNEPAFVAHVGSAVAALRGTTVEDLSTLSWGARVAFGLPDL